MALPFVLSGDTTWHMYLLKSRLSGKGRSDMGSDPLVEPWWDCIGADYELTIFWSWLDRDTYQDCNQMGKWCRIGMVMTNIYYFFIRRAALIPCLQNLMDFFRFKEDKVKYRDLRETAEINIIGYMVGLVLMPGGNPQFIMWFLPFLPLILDMVGLPSEISALLYLDIYAHPHARKWFFKND